MPSKNQFEDLLGKPIGISFWNGQGTSGVLCDYAANTLYVVEYMYQDKFALKQYSTAAIQDVHPFPPCPRRDDVVY